MSNPLAVLPPKVRAYVYAVLALAAVGVGAWQASQGDWLEAVGLFLGALGFGTAQTHNPHNILGKA